jgi:hypothetical protein
MLHLVGLKDQYNPVVKINGRQVVAPGVEPGDLTGLRAWLRANGYPDPTRGFDSYTDAVRAGILSRQVKPGHEHDIMAGGAAERGAKLLRSDADDFAALAGVDVHAQSGDLLLDKNGTEQNFGVGADFDLFAPRGGHAHADGLVVYCIDLSKHIPSVGGGFDILGPARAQAFPGMAQLQAVLEAAARAEPGPLQETPGAQLAVWKVTDDTDVSWSPAAVALLTSAGVAPDTPFPNTAHFSDPNSGSPTTAAVTTSGVVPTTPAAAMPPAPRPVLKESIMVPALFRPRHRASARLRLRLDLAPDHIAFAVVRGKRAAKKLGSREVAVGQTVLRLRLPALPAGSWRIRLTGTFGTQTVRFKVAARR